MACSDTPENNALVDATHSEQDATQEKGYSELEAFDLLSKSEAEEIVGKSLKEGELSEQENIGLKKCIYYSVDEESFIQISLSQKTSVSVMHPKDNYYAIKANFPDHVGVEGIGDDAFIATPGLHILYEDYYIVIAAGNTSNLETIEKLNITGKKAIENLQSFVD